jgi:formylglycine-generating enzyme required for sulfatase activity
MSISASGIEQAITGLTYRNPSAIKARVLNVIKQYYEDLESPEMLRSIATDDLVQKIWDIEPTSSAIQSKRKNLSSIKSSINADLERAWREGRNPEGIMIGPDNTFTMSNEAKDKMIAAFSGAVSADGVFKMDEVNSALKLVSEFLSSRPDAQAVGELEKLKALIEKVTEETAGGDLSGYDVVKRGEDGHPDGVGSGEIPGGSGAGAFETIPGGAVAGKSTTVEGAASDDVGEAEGVSREDIPGRVDDVLALETVDAAEDFAATDGLPEGAAVEEVDVAKDEIEELSEDTREVVEDVSDLDEVLEFEETEEMETEAADAIEEISEDTREEVEDVSDLDEVLEFQETEEMGTEAADAIEEISEDTREEVEDVSDLDEVLEFEETEEMEAEAADAIEELSEDTPEVVDGFSDLDEVPEIEEVDDFEEIEETEDIEMIDNVDIVELFDEAAEPVAPEPSEMDGDTALMDAGVLELVEEIGEGSPGGEPGVTPGEIAVPASDAPATAGSGDVAESSARRHGVPGEKRDGGGAPGIEGTGTSTALTSDVPDEILSAAGDLSDLDEVSEIEEVDDFEEIEEIEDIEMLEEDDIVELIDEAADSAAPPSPSLDQDAMLMDADALDLVEEIEDSSPGGEPAATSGGPAAPTPPGLDDAAGASAGQHGKAGEKGNGGGAHDTLGSGPSAALASDASAGKMAMGDVSAPGSEMPSDATGGDAAANLPESEPMDQVVEMEVAAEEIEEIPDAILEAVEALSDVEQLSEFEDLEAVEETKDVELVEADEIGEIPDEEAQLMAEALAALDEDIELLDEEDLEFTEETQIESPPMETLAGDIISPDSDLLDEIEGLVEAALSDEENGVSDEPVSAPGATPELPAEDALNNGVDEMVKKLLAPPPTEPPVENTSAQPGNWMRNVGLPVDMFDEAGIDFENLENDTEQKKVLAARFDGYLGVMERYYNQLITIPEGDYLVGGNGELEDELPAQKISLPAYYMGKFPITNAVFEIFIDRTGYVTTAEKFGHGFVYYGRFQKIVDDKTGRARSVWNPTYTRKKVAGATWFQPLGPGSSLHNKRNHPVVQVSLKDAKSFAAWTGKRLPTEIEWEAAARTTDGRRWPWGNQWQEHACNTESSGISDTTAVTQYPGGDNPLGISDLLGNVMEWTGDPCEPRYKMERKTIYYVAKGGGWIADSLLTLSSRFRMPADFSSNLLGFRCIAD